LVCLLMWLLYVTNTSIAQHYWSENSIVYFLKLMDHCVILWTYIMVALKNLSLHTPFSICPV
jgi:hypothetical protein